MDPDRRKSRKPGLIRYFREMREADLQVVEARREGRERLEPLWRAHLQARGIPEDEIDRIVQMMWDGYLISQGELELEMTKPPSVRRGLVHLLYSVLFK